VREGWAPVSCGVLVVLAAGLGGEGRYSMAMLASAPSFRLLSHHQARAEAAGRREAV